jgi:serine phosphatase RsbU (regulator of sigma subunit)/anti-sigma regulatory factor (Ser/Thr protein kinase)
MIPLGELRVQATTENLRTIASFLQSVGQRLQLTEKTLFEIDLAVEEAATNIVRHAYSPDAPGDLVISLETLEDVIHITLTDWGRPFEPDKVKPFDLNAPVETRISGGMGLHFIHSLMDVVTRKTQADGGGPNALVMVKKIERLRPGARPPDVARELNAMLSVSQLMIASSDLDHLLQRIVNVLVETLDAERGTLYLVDEATGQLVSQVLVEDREGLQQVRLEVGQGIAGYVASTGAVLNIPDAYLDPRFDPTFDQATGYRTRTILAAPMFDHRHRIVGTVQVLNKRGDVFSTRDERLLVAMVAQAAISIENSRLNAQELRQRLMEQELETARAIQSSFLPQRTPQISGWEIAAYWRPMREVAGDFYDFYTLPDGRLAVVIADVSGKGVPAALFMALSVTVLRFAMGLELSPADVMGRANESILAGQRSRMFVTAFIAYLSPATGETHFACGGHNPALIYRADRHLCEFCSALGVAMGVFDTAAFEEETITLDPGDILVLYTDGITEVINEMDEEFGEDRLAAVVIESARFSAQTIADRIVLAAVNFAGEDGDFDDKTLVVIKREPE